MNGIENFIHKLEKWRDNFAPIQYNYQQYDCEIATLLNLYLHDIKAFINYASKLYNQAIISKKFSLKHPLKNNVICYATHSFAPKDIRWGKDTPAYVNFIFMVDKENKFPFLLMQVHHFFDYILTEDCLISLQYYENNTGRFNDCYAYLSKESISNLRFKDKPFAFTLEQWRPYHYFDEILDAVYKIYHQSQEIIPIKKVSNFFTPKFCQIKNEAEVFIRPVICPMGLKYKNSYLEESLKGFNSLVEKEDKEDCFDKENLSKQELENLILQYKEANV